MNQKNNNLEYNSLNNQRNVTIEKIMDKYGLSFHEANEILSNLEKEENMKNNSEINLEKQDDNSNAHIDNHVSNFKNDVNVVTDEIGLEQENSDSGDTTPKNSSNC